METKTTYTHWSKANGLVYGDSVISNGCAQSYCGFNRRVMVESISDMLRFKPTLQEFGGYQLAEKLIAEGKIYFVNPFKCNQNDCPTRFQYGGFWACNTCYTHISTPEWWIIKVMEDGDSFCCVGKGFVNLQESENYAFGNSRDEAIENDRLLHTNHEKLDTPCPSSTN